MTHLPRRLRRTPDPRWALVSDQAITAEQAARAKQVWAAAGRRREPVIIDGRRFTVLDLRAGDAR